MMLVKLVNIKWIALSKRQQFVIKRFKEVKAQNFRYLVSYLLFTSLGDI